LSVNQAADPKNTDLAETMALAVQIDPALGEMMMDVPAIRIAYLGEDIGIIAAIPGEGVCC